MIIKLKFITLFKIFKTSMTNKKLLISLIFIFFCNQIYSQTNNFYSSSNISSMLEKLDVFGKVLYIAAHPDDENTRLIAYLANEKKYETAYLSATRGGGGQNFLGTHLKDNLGVIRTQELIEARKIDGGKQFFSSALDFGYSKEPVETLNFWNEEKILSDFVWIIRKFRPDIIITRFNQTPYITHGHHTASSILANKAFNLSGDPDAFPEQLVHVKVWQPQRILWNSARRYFNLDEEKIEKMLNVIHLQKKIKLLDVVMKNSICSGTIKYEAMHSRKCTINLDTEDEHHSHGKGHHHEDKHTKKQQEN